jgi:hypothetical protein
MSKELIAHNRPQFDQLHPNVYMSAVALVAWFAISAWAFFDRGGDISLSLVFVTFLFFIAIAIPALLALLWRKYRMPHQDHPRELSFHDWKSGDLVVWGDRLRNMHAAIDVLLPLMAVAFGLTAIGIVFAVVSATT